MAAHGRWIIFYFWFCFYFSDGIWKKTLKSIETVMIVAVVIVVVVVVSSPTVNIRRVW